MPFAPFLPLFVHQEQKGCDTIKLKSEYLMRKSSYKDTSSALLTWAIYWNTIYAPAMHKTQKVQPVQHSGCFYLRQQKEQQKTQRSSLQIPL